MTLDITTKIKEETSNCLKSNYNLVIDSEKVLLQNIKKEIPGDFSINVFPFVKQAKSKPQDLAEAIGSFLHKKINHIEKYEVVKGFLNLFVKSNYWSSFLIDFTPAHTQKSKENHVMIEFSSPNTNKPLHLGHIRNNLLGESISRILKVTGNKVTKTNLINDRGIHICKSMLAYQKQANNATPESTGLKGDRLVGDYYVAFDKMYKQEIQELIDSGKTKEEAEKLAPSMVEAREMLKKWEAGDKETIALWEKLNNMVYKGFDETYKKLDIDFDKIYYESNTYKSGKKVVLKGLEENILIKKDDGSIWADLTDKNLDKKILLRSDGTSVYMTQDIGTALARFDEFNLDKMLYVVGNEQNYHFNVLKIVLDKLGYKSQAEKIQHFSYGMVELPEGKMKSREGTVVDADDLIAEMVETAEAISLEAGKLDELSASEKEKTIFDIAMGALKYYILKVDPKKQMVFNPAESIDFNGNTGSFVQYGYARIQSVLRKAANADIEITNNIESIELNEQELELIKKIHQYGNVLSEAERSLSPALIANYSYDLVKAYNRFYHDYQILNESNKDIVNFRLVLSQKIGETIKHAMNLLGINVPDRM